VEQKMRLYLPLQMLELQLHGARLGLHLRKALVTGRQLGIDAEIGQRPDRENAHVVDEADAVLVARKHADGSWRKQLMYELADRRYKRGGGQAQQCGAGKRGEERTSSMEKAHVHEGRATGQRKRDRL